VHQKQWKIAAKIAKNTRFGIPPFALSPIGHYGEKFNIGAQLHLLPAGRPVLKLLLLVFLVRRLCAPIIVKFGRRRCPPNILLTTKVENFQGSFGEFRSRKPKKLRNNLKIARKVFIFAPCRRIPWSKIMKLITLMLLYGLHLCFNFGKIRFINDGFIPKKNLGTKKSRSVFGP